VVKPVETKMQFKTEKKVGKVGVMLVGLGGNNGWYVDMTQISEPSRLSSWFSSLLPHA
jgi:myo-inositol-1-phosphate synthase